MIHHVITRGKRRLGICLGEQLIYVYLKLWEMVEEQGYEGDPVKAICDLRTEKGPEFSVLLHRLLGKDTLRAASFHHLHVPPTQNLVTINAWAADGSGVVEGVEYGEKILGIQGHLEMDGLLPNCSPSSRQSDASHCSRAFTKLQRKCSDEFSSEHF